VAEIRTYGSACGAGNLGAGEVLVLHLESSLLDGDGRVLPQRLKAVGRMGGRMWVRTQDNFTPRRPD
jgi:hypothetical protein